MFWEEGGEVGGYYSIIWGLMMKRETHVRLMCFMCATFEFKYTNMPKFDGP